MKWYQGVLEKDLIPEWLIQIVIRHFLGVKLRCESQGSEIEAKQRLFHFVEELKKSPVAIHTLDANKQHYEVPARFFELVLGKRLKYSSCYYPEGVASLDQAEEAMLTLTCERAQLKNGQNVLELGCGWGSLSLYMAEKFPNSKITAVSNSRTQKIFIDAQAKSRGFSNLEIITADMVNFDTEKKFDRIVSVEMFEHMRNYQILFERISRWMKPDAKLFIHIFSHTKFAYPYETKGDDDWIGEHFFSGGIMPSDDLFTFFQDHLKIVEHWRVNGIHYYKTCYEWLARMKAHKSEIIPLFVETYGKDALKMWVYWKIFFMSCAELFGYRNGTEWIVSHYLFKSSQRDKAINK